MERIALANLLRILPGKDRRPVLLRDLCGMGAAVISHHKNADPVSRIILRPDAVQYMGEHLLFVSRRDQHGVFMKNGRAERSLLSEKGQEEIDELMRVEKRTEDR